MSSTRPCDCAGLTQADAGHAICRSSARRRIRLPHSRVLTDLPSSLVARFGAEAPNVIAAATCERPTDPVADGIDVIRAEFEYAVSHEGALTVDDIVDRRTRIGLVDADRDTVLTVAGELLAGGAR